MITFQIRDLAALSPEPKDPYQAVLKAFKAYLEGAATSFDLYKAAFGFVVLQDGSKKVSPYFNQDLRFLSLNPESDVPNKRLGYSYAGANARTYYEAGILKEKKDLMTDYEAFLNDGSSMRKLFDYYTETELKGIYTEDTLKAYKKYFEDGSPGDQPLPAVALSAGLAKSFADLQAKTSINE